jgi:NitT/TauT family transport system substrate-binding protein
MFATALRTIVLAAGLLPVVAAGAFAQAEINVGFSPNLPQVPLYIAHEKGFYKEEGLNVVLKPTVAATPQLLPQLATGGLDVLFGGGAASLFNAMDGGIKFAMVADGGQVDPEWDGYPYLLVVRKDLADQGVFKSLADLKGMRVAAGVQGTTLAYFVFRSVETAGLKPEDVGIKYVKALADVGVAFENKVLDAAATIVPQNVGLVRNGIAVDWIDARKAAPGMQAYTLIFSESMMAKRRDEGKAFLRAYAKAIAWYKQALKGDRQELKAIAAKWTKLPSDVLDGVSWTFYDDKLRMNVADIRKQYNLWVSLKLARPDLKVEDFIDERIAAEALAAR